MKKFLLVILAAIMAVSIANAQWKPGDPITDSRDGQTYKTVKIGNQVWMAENLNIGTLIQSTGAGYLMKDNSVIEKYCWNDDIGNCDGTGGKMKRGGFYEWKEAVQYWSGQPALPVQGICPKGWYIPSNAEWNVLLGFLGGESAYQKMVVGGGSGFDALLTGYRCTGTGTFRVSAMSPDTRTYFWTAEQTDAENATFLEIGAGSLHAMSFLKSVGLCVRCLWDGVTSNDQPGIKLNLNSLDFGTVNINQTAMKDFEIINSGTANLIISNIRIQGTNASYFTITSPATPFTIPPASKIIITIGYSPASEGQHTAELVITSNATNEPSKKLQIVGKSNKSKPKIECTVTSLLFDHTEIDKSTTKEISISNTGDADCIINQILIDNDFDQVFSVLNPQDLQKIAAGSEVKAIIGFAPKNVGNFVATFRLVFADIPELSIELHGTSIAHVEDAEAPGSPVTISINPNPITKSAVITYSLATDIPQSIDMHVINIKGETVASLVKGIASPGSHNIEFKPDGLASGKYYVIAIIGNRAVKVPFVINW